MSVGNPWQGCSPTASRTPDPKIHWNASDLAGAWRLVSVETLRPNGETIYPFYGKHPQGLIIYDPTGWVSVQIVSDPKAAVPGDSRDSFKNAPAAGKAIAADGYYAYFGTYTVNAAASTVTHHLKDSLYPGERGADFPRHSSIVNGQLTLVAKVDEMGEEHQRRLIWQRTGIADAKVAAGQSQQNP